MYVNNSSFSLREYEGFGRHKRNMTFKHNQTVISKKKNTTSLVPFSAICFRAGDVTLRGFNNHSFL